MKEVTLTIRYTGFDVAFVVQNNPTRRRLWEPGKGEYEKNLFATYMFNGRFEEYNQANELIDLYVDEAFYSRNMVWDFPTYEIVPTETAWLCFTSYKPFTADFLRLNGSNIVPAGIGAYCVLGTFTFEGITAQALNYMKPRDHNVEITGNAKVILVKPGEFRNTPPL